MIGLTQKQAECLELIKKLIAEKDISPTFEEVRIGMGLKSVSGVSRLITGLKQRGKIDYWPKVARSIVVIPEASFANLFSDDLEVKIRRYAIKRGIGGREALIELLESGVRHNGR